MNMGRAAVTAAVRDGELWIDVAHRGTTNSVSIRPPWDFETLKIACDCLIEAVAGTSAFELTMAATNAASAMSGPVPEGESEGAGE